MRGKCKLRETESEGDGVKGDDGGGKERKKGQIKRTVRIDGQTGGGINILNCNAIADISIIGLTVVRTHFLLLSLEAAGKMKKVP